MTNTTRLAKTHDTVGLFIISIDPETQTYATLLNRKGLPYDCYKVVQVPSPTGGVLVICGNGVVYCDQVGVCSAYVNSYFGWGQKIAKEQGRKEPLNPVYSADSSRDYREWGMEFDEAACWFINPGMCYLWLMILDTCLLSNSTGELVQISLVGKEGAGVGWARKKGGVKGIEMKRLGIKAIATDSACCIGWTPGFKSFDCRDATYLFMGSKTRYERFNKCIATLCLSVFCLPRLIKISK
jgi:hypothetical protein